MDESINEGMTPDSLTERAKAAQINQLNELKTAAPGADRPGLVACVVETACAKVPAGFSVDDG